MPKDYYELLGVSRDISKEDLKKAYRKKAVENHPDRNQNDTEAEKRFKEISEAYSVLSDDKKKQVYDQYGHQGLEGMAGGGGSGFSSSNDFGDIFESVFGGEDIFSSFFGGGRTQRVARGRDIQYRLDISLKDAFYGCKENISMYKNTSCDSCNGNGSANNSQPSTCSTCHGNGKVQQSRGLFSVSSTCSNCGGSGSIISDPCRACRGKGISKKENKIAFSVPKGIHDGQKIKLTEQGESARNGVNGDLYILINIRSDKYYFREDDDIYCEVSLAIPQLLLGTSLKIKTIDDKKMKLKVPSGTKAGVTMRFREEGFPVLNSGRRGDMYIKLQIEIPKKISGKIKKLYEEIAQLEKPNEEPSLKEISHQEKSSFW